MLGKRMLAAYIYGKKDLRLEEVKIPRINPEDILIRVRACGICGSDLRMFSEGPSTVVPLIPGHEASGEIVKIGCEVKDYEIGDRVAPILFAGCARCRSCLSGKENLCPNKIRVGASGAFAEFMKIPGSLLRRVRMPKIPKDCSFEVATLIEPLACAIHGTHRAKIEFGNTLIIIGDGPMGLLHILYGKFMDAPKIVLLGHHDKRLLIAKDLGADIIVNSLNEDAVSKVLDITRGEGGSNVIVAAGRPEAIEMGLKVVATGGTLVIFGGCPKGSRIQFDPNFIHYREICVTGSFDCTINEFYKSVSLINKLNVRPLISKVYPLRSIQEAYDFAISKEELRIVIAP